MKHLLSLLFLGMQVFGEAPAPYPASGWKPEGPSFELPTVESNSKFKQTAAAPQTQFGPPQNNRPPQNQYVPSQNQYISPQNQYAPTQNQYAPPQNQYAPPQNQYAAPQYQYAPPQNQYAPPSTQNGQRPPKQYEPPTKQEESGDQQNFLPQNQYRPPSKQQRIPQTQNGTPLPQQAQQSPGQYAGGGQPQNRYGAPQPLEPTPSPFDVRSGGRNQYESPLPVEPFSFPQNQNETPDAEYLPSSNPADSRPNRYNQETLRNRNNAKRLLFPTERNAEFAYGFVQDRNGRQENQFEAGENGAPHRKNADFAYEFVRDQNERQENSYEAGKIVKEYKTIVLTEEEQKGYDKKFGTRIATTTTTSRPTKRVAGPRRPETATPDGEDFDDVPADPNIAVATAVANGQYYLLLPDGRLQKVTFKTTQTEEEAKTDGFTANLMYQFVEPIKDPIYTVDGAPYLPSSNQN